MTGRTLRIGFIPLADAAALIVAVDKGFRRRGRPRRRAGARGVVVERARQAQYRPVRRRASARAGRDRLEPRARPRQGADRRAVRARPERQCHHGVAGALCGAADAADGDLPDPMVSARALARVVAAAQGARRGTAHLRHDVPVLHPQLSAALLDGGRRRRSRRGRAAGGAAAALHGGEPRERACRRLLRRRAVEFGRGRSRHRPHPAFRVGDRDARCREGAGGARSAGPTRIRMLVARLVRAHRPRRRLRRGRRQSRRGRRHCSRRRTASASRRR